VRIRGVREGAAPSKSLPMLSNRRFWSRTSWLIAIVISFSWLVRLQDGVNEGNGRSMCEQNQQHQRGNQQICALDANKSALPPSPHLLNASIMSSFSRCSTSSDVATLD